MDEMESLSDTKWECKYHVVFISKWRRKTLYGELRRHLGEVFRKLAEQKESRIEEGHLIPDHVHMMGGSDSGLHPFSGTERCALFTYAFLCRNWLGLLDAAGLTPDEHMEAECIFASRIGRDGMTDA
jgi:putative transposase